MTFKEKRDKLIAYMQVKMDESDWHAVADVANDLRVLETQEKVAKDTASFLVENGIRIEPTVIDGVKYMKVSRQ